MFTDALADIVFLGLYAPRIAEILSFKAGMLFRRIVDSYHQGRVKPLSGGISKTRWYGPMPNTPGAGTEGAGEWPGARCNKQRSW